MPRPRLEVADVFGRHGASFLEAYPASRTQRRTMRAIQQCRTATLGGHLDQCDSCGHIRPSYNSCRNRHCPKCQSLERDRWLAERQTELLPVHYFHVVFTVPDHIASIALQNKRVVYNILFRAAAETLRRIAADPKHLGAQIGFLAVLHTWGQTLLHHPHIHCVIPGGGISLDGSRWIGCRPKFFLPVKVLSRLFRGLFLHYLKLAFDKDQLSFHGQLAHLSDNSAFARLLGLCRNNKWHVYAKRPFGGPAQVLNYLGRYTHRVAISNNRLLSLQDGKVAFSWKDYRTGNANRTMTLAACEFIRRFLLHVLPDGFVRIRHYGLLSNCHRNEKLALCRQLIAESQPVEDLSAEPVPTERLAGDWKKRYELLTGESLEMCPLCHNGRMLRVQLLEPGAQLARRFQPEVVDSS
ncbi:MAG: IS91 family transposase [Acidobacteriota bacterium]